MAFTLSQLDDITTWCSSSSDLELERARARPRFFGDDDQRPIKYWEGAGDVVSRQTCDRASNRIKTASSTDTSPAQRTAGVGHTFSKVSVKLRNSSARTMPIERLIEEGFRARLHSQLSGAGAAASRYPWRKIPPGSGALPPR